MFTSKRLVLAHFWLAFAMFGLALLLGEWQMYIRSPLHAWLQNPDLYYRYGYCDGLLAQLEKTGRVVSALRIDPFSNRDDCRPLDTDLADFVQ